MQIPEGMWVAQCVATAAKLGIADALARSQPQGSITLASAVGAEASALARLLRALASLGVLAEPSPQQYALTPVSELLRRDVPGSMRDWLIAETDTPHWQAWGQLYEGVRSGRTVVPELFGMHIYDYYTTHPADLAYFSRAMGNVSALVANGTVRHYDFRALDISSTLVEQMAAFCWQSWRPIRMCTAQYSTGLRWWELPVRRLRPRTVKRGAKPLQGISLKRCLKVGTYTCSSSS
jgi:hypothetical protein